MEFATGGDAVPTVVDSPIPSTPLDPVPVDVSGIPDAPGSAAPPSEPDPKAAIEEYAQSIGISPDVLQGFTDIDNAKAAANLFLSRIAQQGQQYQQYEQPQYQHQYVPPQPSDPYAYAAPPPYQYGQRSPATPDARDAALEKLAGENTDPNIVAAIKHLQQEIQQSKQEAIQARQSVQQWQQYQVQQMQQQTFDRALSVIDKVASPKYGVAGNRNFQQNLAVENVLRIADRLHNGWGPNTPPIEFIIQQALQLDGYTRQQQQQQQTGVPSVPTITRGGQRVGGPAIPQGQQFGRQGANAQNADFLADKEFMDGARQILRAPR